ncbi:MAG: NAD(P)/FAD-dependent oxidoreductase [Chloroflexi bacterium]|nr:MAG: NAD(P)/FAD-dependent oxidoreductase [Chloroflexota bacterium]
MFEVIIVGAGPAGLSAALILGRSLRHVLVCDSGEYRNAASHALHGFLTRDGIEPAELLRLGREQLRSYENIEVRTIKIVDAIHQADHFEVIADDGTRLSSRKLILATGIVDELPDIAGVEAFYGQGVFHCPYCDGWEYRDQPLAIYGAGKHGRKLALELSQWSQDLVLCTNGPARLSTIERERMARNNIRICEERIARLEGKDGMLERIVFTNNEVLPCRALFFRGHERQRSDLAEKLGCAFTKKGAVRTSENEATNVPGLYVVGDASRRVQLVIIAAAEGAAAAWAINTELLKEGLAK